MYTYDKPDNLVEMFELSLKQNTDRRLFGTADEDGKYSWVTYKEVGSRVDNFRSGLLQYGIKAGDAVGIIANNRTEWAVAAFGCFGIGAYYIPMYEKELPKTWKHIINDSGIKLLFVASEEIYKQIEQFRDEVPELEHIFLIDGTTRKNMTDLEQKGSENLQPSIRPQPTDVAVLIYTSGTTGDPKGVLLTHGNFTSNVIAGQKMFPEFNRESRSLSILPWAHSYGLTAELFNFIHLGGSMGFVRDVTTVGEDMQSVAPTFLIAVPRVFNKIYDGLWTKMNETGGLALKLFKMGLENAKLLRELSKEGKTALLPQLKYRLADRIVFSKIRKRFGGQLNGSLTASAMMNLEVTQFFMDIGIPVFDAYGLTETSPAVSMNNRENRKAGSVGRPLDQVHVVIDTQFTDDQNGEGEVIVYGPNVMKGYHNKPEATKEVITEDGGFRTGDLGIVDEDGYLFITGRIKEQYKLENGKYVFPASLEEEIQISPWVENVLIYGEGRSHNICLIVPDWVKLLAWAKQHDLDNLSQSELIAHPEVETLIKDSISNHLKGKFGGYEIPQKIVLVEQPFSVDNGMLTHTMKLKRSRVLEEYEEQVNSAYNNRKK